MATLMAFPGSYLSVQRDIASDFMKRTTLKLCKIAHSTADLAATIMLESSSSSSEEPISRSKGNSKLVIN